MDRIGARGLDAGVVAVVVFGAVVLSIAISVFVGSAGFGYDYAAYDAAARRIVSGEPLYLADSAARYAAGAYEGLYLYPPPMAIAIVPLTVLATNPATVAWMLLRVAMLIGTCIVMPVGRRARLLTFAAACLSFPVLFDLNIGNVSLVVLGLTALAWRMPGSVVAAVAHAVLISIRFPFGVYFVEWVAQGRWRTIGLTIVAGVGLIAVSALIVGPSSFVDYVTILRGLPDISTGPHNLSLKSTALAFGIAADFASPSVLVGVVLGIAAIIVAARRRDADIAFVVTAIATLLVAPFIHPHYLVLLLLPTALMIDRGWTWAFAIPLLGWLPDPALPLIAPAVIGLLFLVRSQPTVPEPGPAFGPGFTATTS